MQKKFKPFYVMPTSPRQRDSAFYRIKNAPEPDGESSNKCREGIVALRFDPRALSPDGTFCSTILSSHRSSDG